MIKDIRLHGFVSGTNERYEYFTTVIGQGLHTHFFNEQNQNETGSHDRFFLSGNEIIIHSDRIYHRGNGGTFCEYMFGMELPIKDLIKPEVNNRLVMYGARYDEAGERIVFTNNTTGQESINKTFEEGHAFANYYFFIAGDIQGDLKTVQETLLRFTGKTLKRFDLSLDKDGGFLAQKLYQEINIPRWTVVIVKLVDCFAQDYYKKFAESYKNGQSNLPQVKQQFEALANRYQLSREKRDRLELDIIEKQVENRSLIDEYKETLAMHHNSSQEQTLLFKCSRLRTLASRRQIPIEIFDQLDQIIKQPVEENSLPDFILSLQDCTNKIFSQESDYQLTESDLAILLEARTKALLHHYGKFDDILMELGSGQSGRKAELFSIIVAHLERFQSAYEIVNSVAFIDDYELTEEELYLLARSQDVIDNIKEGFFEKLVFCNLERQQYLNRYGRERLRKLKECTKAIILGELLADEVITIIQTINSQARLRRILDTQLQECVRDIYKEPLSKIEQETLRNQLSTKLNQQGLISGLIPEELFASSLFALREEYLYIDELLPQIVANRDRQLRDDFLENSDLDRFRTEELEQQYFRSFKVSNDTLEWFANEVRN